ncbi:hypothetical protein E0494_01975 [Marinilabiliaceae bacterium JC040]|nr:hypothetical protein [Marinilabiliaceae bacterium JC040]
MNKFKYCGLVLLLFVGVEVFAQNNTSSYFSRYGLGDIEITGKGRVAAMGGAGIALGSKYSLNLLNPASYGSLDSMSFIFEGGLKALATRFETSNGKNEVSTINFDYLTIAFPVTRWWRSSLGLTPYSSIGYKLDSEITKEDKDGNFLFKLKSKLDGKGGLSKAYYSNSFVLFKDLYLGANVSYLFGTIERSKKETFLKQDGSIDKSFIPTSKNEKYKIHDILFDFGFQYNKRISEDYKFSLGGIYTPKTHLNNSYTNIAGVVNESKDNLNIYIPEKIGTGLSFEYKDNLIINFDYIIEKWKGIDLLETTSSYKYQDSKTIAMGIEYIPNRRSRNYLGAIAYRAGFHYTDSYMMIKHDNNYNSLKDMGISFGFGFPLKQSSTFINVAFELGQRGNISDTQMKETYGKVSLSFSLFSRWFYKQKYK